MPFDQKYDDATREAATARVLQRRATNPKDRHVFTVVANEFNVGQQSLRAWVAAASPEAEESAPAPKKRRPRFSPVVTTKMEPDDEPEESDAVADPGRDRAVDRAPAGDVPAAVAPSALAPASARAPLAPAPGLSPEASTAALEAEVAELRRGNEALKDAMRVLLGD